MRHLFSPAREEALRQFQNTASDKKANLAFMQLMKLGLATIEQMAEIAPRPSLEARWMPAVRRQTSALLVEDELEKAR